MFRTFPPKYVSKWFLFSLLNTIFKSGPVHISGWLTVMLFAKDSKLLTRVLESILKQNIYTQRRNIGWMEWISNLQVNLPAGKDGNRYHIPWRRQLMMFREAFHLSLRLQKMKLPFPTIKDPGKVGEQNIYKICTQKNILTPLWKFSLRFVIWNLMIATIKVINERKSHVLPLLILISWRGCCFCFCSDQWCPLCALATGGLFASR